MTFLPELKSRSLRTQIGSISTRASGLAAWGAYAPIYDSGFEEVISQCHTGRWPPRSRTEGDIGGIMRLRRSYSKRNTVPVNQNTTRGQTAIAQVVGYTMGLPEPAYVGDSFLNAFGTSAIAAVLPTNPNASLATAIGELRRDGLPSIPGASFRDRADLARKAGHEYLNVEFGWLPLVNDLQAFADSVRRSKQLIDQYRRDSDRKIRRRFVAAPLIETSAPFNGSALWHSGGGALFSPVTVTKQTETRLWFSGAFRYHVPVGDDFYSRLSRYEQYANYLFGTRITPELVWNLAPWSWAVDWFTNAGDVIHNISQLGVDGLVMQYGYAMRHSRTSNKARSSISLSSLSGPTYTAHGSYDVVAETKERISANPYGFGITDTSLSARQLAVLAALGLTRGKRTT